MATQEEIELERDRIKNLVHALGNVLETISSSAQDAGTALDNLKVAQDAVTTAKAQLTQRAADVVTHVTQAMSGMPTAVSAKILKELDGSIQTSVGTAVSTLTTAANNASETASALDKAIKLNLWTIVGIAVGASILAACFTSLIFCLVVLRSSAGS